jgi:hypothetical protein
MQQILVIGAIFLLIPFSNVYAEQCRANANCDTKVDLSDLVIMKQDFNKTGCDPCMCNPNSECPTGLMKCNGKCVDPQTDESYCGSCSNSCASGEVCFSGICYTGGVQFVYEAAVPKTWQTTKYTDYDDGDLQKGVAWPNPRFTDNNNGTVTDNLTGLIWLKDANCYGMRSWAQALTDCHGLNSGECELSDGSAEGDWRLPNRFELESLLDLQYYDPCISNTTGTGHWSSGDPFENVQSAYYWSSTTVAANYPYLSLAWSVLLVDGRVIDDYKGNGDLVWPVRGGQ